MAQLRALRPDLDVVPIRGNADTRLRKVTDGELDAVVLAHAGLKRIGRLEAVAEVFDPDQMLPAPGQGALALECRADRDRPPRAPRHARRRRRPGRPSPPSGRSSPCSRRAARRPWAHTLRRIDENTASDGDRRGYDGERQIRLSASGHPDDAEQLGRDLAARMLARGGRPVDGGARSEPRSKKRRDRRARGPPRRPAATPSPARRPGRVRLRRHAARATRAADAARRRRRWHGRRRSWPRRRCRADVPRALSTPPTRRSSTRRGRPGDSPARREAGRCVARVFARRPRARLRPRRRGQGLRQGRRPVRGRPGRLRRHRRARLRGHPADRRQAPRGHGRRRPGGRRRLERPRRRGARS